MSAVILYIFSRSWEQVWIEALFPLKNVSSRLMDVLAFRLSDPDEKKGLLFHEFWQQSCPFLVEVVRPSLLADYWFDVFGSSQARLSYWISELDANVFAMMLTKWNLLDCWLFLCREVIGLSLIPFPFATMTCWRRLPIYAWMGFNILGQVQCLHILKKILSKNVWLPVWKNICSASKALILNTVNLVKTHANKLQMLHKNSFENIAARKMLSKVFIQNWRALSFYFPQKVAFSAFLLIYDMSLNWKKVAATGIFRYKSACVKQVYVWQVKNVSADGLFPINLWFSKLEQKATILLTLKNISFTSAFFHW